VTTARRSPAAGSCCRRPAPSPSTRANVSNNQAQQGADRAPGDSVATITDTTIEGNRPRSEAGSTWQRAARTSRARRERQPRRRRGRRDAEPTPPDRRPDRDNHATARPSSCTAGAGRRARGLSIRVGDLVEHSITARLLGDERHADLTTLGPTAPEPRRLRRRRPAYLLRIWCSRCYRDVWSREHQIAEVRLAAAP